jgi:hypothetical protein
VIPNSCAALFLVLLGLSIAGILRSQEPETTAPIFSGTVTQLTDRSVTVVRKVPGQPPVTREFMRDDKTTVEGKLRNRSRVTVRYKALDEGGFVAVHIIVR